MEVLDKIRWYSKDNELSASLMRFHASIHIHKNQNKLVFQTVITDENMDKLIMSFSTLEEAFTFVDSIVNKSWTMAEILEKCRENYESKMPKIKKGKNPSSTSTKRDNNQ